MSAEEKFPSQDPLEAARTIASDEYQQQQREAAEREAEHEAQTKRLDEWLDGSQANAEDLAKYLESRPYEDSEGVHDPHSGEVVEVGGRHTASQRRQGRWGNRYFEQQRGDYYDQSHENPAELSLDGLLNSYLDAEADGNRTFVEDYEGALVKKLNDKETSISDLAYAQALAEVETEISGADTSRTAGLVADAINKRVTEYHNKNIGKSSSYEMYGEDGKLRTVSAHEAAMQRTEKFRADIERMKNKHLAKLEEENADLIEQRSKQNNPSSEKAESGTTPENGETAGNEPGGDESDPVDPDDDPDQANQAEDEDDGSDAGEPGTDQVPHGNGLSKPELISPKERVELFSERLHDWSNLLKNPRFVPTAEEYDEIVTLADNIEFRHLDPAVDGQSGMGYFMKGSDVRLNPTEARTLLDKARVTDWLLVDWNEEEFVKSVLDEDDPREVMEMTERATNSQLMYRVESYDYYLGTERQVDDEENLEEYKDYLRKRLALEQHINTKYRDAIKEMRYYPHIYIRDAVNDFRERVNIKASKEELNRNSYSRVALGGIKKTISRKFQGIRGRLRRNRNEVTEDWSWSELTEDAHEAETQPLMAPEEEPTEEREV